MEQVPVVNPEGYDKMVEALQRDYARRVDGVVKKHGAPLDALVNKAMEQIRHRRDAAPPLEPLPSGGGVIKNPTSPGVADLREALKDQNRRVEALVHPHFPKGQPSRQTS